jgi:hypothetical protein
LIFGGGLGSVGGLVFGSVSLYRDYQKARLAEAETLSAKKAVMDAKQAVMDAVAKGYYPAEKVSAGGYATRDEVDNRIHDILTPRAACENYWLICGGHGTGKTTAMIHHCNKIKSGIIYVEIPSKDSGASGLNQVLCSALGIVAISNKTMKRLCSELGLPCQ